MHRDLSQLFPCLGLGFPFVNWSRQLLRLLSLQNSSVPKRATSIPTPMLPLLCSASDHALGVCWLWGTLLSLAAFPLLIFKKVVLITQSCLTLCDPMDCSPPGSSVHGILWARIVEWIAIPFSRGFSRLRNQTPVFHIVGGFCTIWATREALIIDSNAYSAKEFFWFGVNVLEYD